MDENKHGQELPGARVSGTVDVQIKAVFAPGDHLAAFRILKLSALIPECGRVAYTGPSRGRSRRLPTKIANWRSGIGDAEKSVDLAIGLASNEADLASNEFDNRFRSFLRVQQATADPDRDKKIQRYSH
jgi:hypothetical protein